MRADRLGLVALALIVSAAAGCTSHQQYRKTKDAIPPILVSDLEQRRDVDLVVDAEHLGEVERGEYRRRLLAFGDEHPDWRRRMNNPSGELLDEPPVRARLKTLRER